MDARDWIDAAGRSGMAEILGRDLEMGRVGSRRFATRTHDQALLELAAEQERLGDELMRALDRSAKARSYVSDPDSNPDLAAILLVCIIRDRRAMCDRIGEQRLRAERLVGSTGLARALARNN